MGRRAEPIPRCSVSENRPGPAARRAQRRLLILYGQHVPLALTPDDVRLTVERTDGTTASFFKELIRRSVLESLHEDPALTAVTGAHLARVLDDLLDTAQAVTRTLLGAGLTSRPARPRIVPCPGRPSCDDETWPPAVPRRRDGAGH